MTFYTQVAPIIMIGVIIINAGIFCWAYWPKHRKRFEQDAQIPLRSDE